MKRPKLLLLFVLPVIAFFTGCYPDKIDYVDEYDLAGTMYDEEADFSSYETYFLADTIIHLTDDGEDDPNFTREHDAFILDLIRDNMTEMGYTAVDTSSVEEPDLLLFVEVLSSDYYQYWGGWYNYWGGWYGGWSWYYPGYPWYPSYPWYPGYVTSYSTGTLMIEMGTVDDSVPDKPELEMKWMGLIDGLLTSNKDSSRQRLEKQINQLFEQSEYLQQ